MHMALKVSNAAQSKYCMKKKDIFGNASSYVQLCYLNELCGIIIRLMPVQDWLCGEVKEASPSSEIYPGLLSSIKFTLLFTETCTLSVISNKSETERGINTAKEKSVVWESSVVLETSQTLEIKLCVVCINTLPICTKKCVHLVFRNLIFSKTKKIFLVNLFLEISM